MIKICKTASIGVNSEQRAMAESTARNGRAKQSLASQNERSVRIGSVGKAKIVEICKSCSIDADCKERAVSGIAPPFRCSKQSGCRESEPTIWIGPVAVGRIIQQSREVVQRSKVLCQNLT